MLPSELVLKSRFNHSDMTGELKHFRSQRFCDHMIKTPTLNSPLIVAQMTCGHFNCSHMHQSWAALLNVEQSWDTSVETSSHLWLCWIQVSVRLRKQVIYSSLFFMFASCRKEASNPKRENPESTRRKKRRGNTEGRDPERAQRRKFGGDLRLGSIPVSPSPQARRSGTPLWPI